MHSTAVIFFSIILFIRLKMLKTTHHNNYTGFFFLILRFVCVSFFCVAIGAARSMSSHLTIVLLHLFYITSFFFIFNIYSLRCTERTHSQYALINSRRSKWNWNNGILKSDTLLPFHLTIYTVHVYLHATQIEERGEGGGGSIRFYWLFALLNIFLTTSRFVNTFRLICERMCIVSFRTAKYA